MSKRGGIFDQGKPERPYDERDDPADVPQRATAAQLASRKIKTAKARSRPAGASSANTQSANLGTSQSGFSFGAVAPSSKGSGISFGGNDAFGNGATNSFPPVQSSASSNTFTSSSFPAFGGGQNTAFDPQPPSTGFSFTSGGSNPFATSSSSPTLNGTGSTPPAFGAFGAQPPSNPFGGLGQANTTSAASGGLFGTTSGTSPNALFGTANSTVGVSSASQAFSFGGAVSSAQNTASKPAPSNPFSALNTSAQNATPKASLFSGFGADTTKNESAMPASSLFANMVTSAQDTTKAATTTAPLSGLFDFGSATPATSTSITTTSTVPSAKLFSDPAYTGPTASTPAVATASNPFAALQTSTSPFPSLLSSMNQSTQATSMQEMAPAAPAATSSLFNGFKPIDQGKGLQPEAPSGNPFASLAKPNSTPALAPAVTTSGFSLFGTPLNKDTASTGKKSAAPATVKAPEASKPSLFGGFSTPQPAKAANAGVSHGGLFSAAQPKTGTGLFSQSCEPDSSKENGITNPQSLFSSAPLATTAVEKGPAPREQPSQKPTFDPFGPSSAAGRSNMFSSTEEPPPISPSLTMPTLTGAAALAISTSQESSLPKVPKVHVPKEWNISATTNNNTSPFKHVSALVIQLRVLNEKYLQQLSTVSLSADWSSMSSWHHKHSTDIKNKIDQAKKQRAAAKGITGNESMLSTKRKVNNDVFEGRDASPTKRARAGETPSAPTPQLFESAPKPNPPVTSTSNMFAKAIGDKPSTANIFAAKSAEKPAAASPTGSAPSSTTNGTSTVNVAPASSGFKPSFGESSSGGSGFLSQFAKAAKTYDELAAERKAKAMAEDYDSDDETEEQWSARYDKKETERLAAEKKQIAAAPNFSISDSCKPSGSSIPSANPFASLAKPMSDASTPGLFSSRLGSPALSTGGQSIFDAPSDAPTPSSNIFGHLSSGPSSNNQEDQDLEDQDQEDQHRIGHAPKDTPVGSIETTTPPKPRAGESETEDEETFEEAPRRKTQAASSGASLLSRMTRDDEADSEKENSTSTSLFGLTNGTQNAANKPFQFFDFGAASSATTMTPKANLFAGDQTFKPGTPIKFGDSTATETKSIAPKFVFQAATPSAADFSTTPAKPPPVSLFSFAQAAGGPSFLAPNAGISSGASVTSSVFSSRAGTPLSEAENSTASAAEDDEDGGKHEQVDLSQLTEDEKDANDIIFHADVVLAKHQVDKGDGTKTWTNLAKGPLWILKDKVTAKCFVRIRIASGATPLDYRLLPALQATVTGSSKKMVMATKPAKEGGLQQVLYAVKTSEVAEEFARRYNESLPSK